jgi:hypothetical protein
MLYTPMELSHCHILADDAFIYKKLSSSTYFISEGLLTLFPYFNIYLVFIQIIIFWDDLPLLLFYTLATSYRLSKGSSFLKPSAYQPGPVLLHVYLMHRISSIHFSYHQEFRLIRLSSTLKGIELPHRITTTALYIILERFLIARYHYHSRASSILDFYLWRFLSNAPFRRIFSF